MNVVGHATDPIDLTTEVFRYSIDIGIEFPIMLDRDCFLAAIGAEDDVVV